MRVATLLVTLRAGGRHTAAVNNYTLFTFGSGRRGATLSSYAALLRGELGLIKQPGSLFGRFQYFQVLPIYNATRAGEMAG